MQPSRIPLPDPGGDVVNERGNTDLVLRFQGHELVVQDFRGEDDGAPFDQWYAVEDRTIVPFCTSHNEYCSFE